jgi:hypothetical protein
MLSDLDRALYAEYVTVKERWEALNVICAHRQGTAAQRSEREQAEARHDQLKAFAGDPVPGDPPCCQRYGRLHVTEVALQGCRWYGYKAAAVRPDRTAAEAGRYIIMRLVQLEERLANHPRANRDGHVHSIIGATRDAADALTERYEFTAPTGRCASCGRRDVTLVAALAADTDALVCLLCRDELANPVIPLEALWDDRAVYVVTRGHLAVSAGRELTEDEIAQVSGRLEDERAREAVDNAVYAALGHSGHQCADECGSC